MPRPKILGAPAARKKRARKPWTLQRTMFNTFIAFIYLLPSFSSVFSDIMPLFSPYLRRSRRLTSLRPILPPRRRHRCLQARGQEDDQAPNRPVHVGEVLRVPARTVGVGQDIGQDTDDKLEPPKEFCLRHLGECSSECLHKSLP